MNPNSVDDTMEDELSKQRNKEEGRIKREAKAKMKKIAKQEAKKAKKAASKAARQAARKSIVYSTGSVIVSVFVVIFMIIGIVSFITTMPSLVQDKILSVVTGAYDGINKLFQGEDYYLEKLAGDLERTKQKEVLKYLDDMGVDPVGFGFAPFYTRYEDGTVDYDHTVEIEEIYEFGTLTGLWDSIEYNKQLKEKIKNEDLIFKYIVSNERTFLLDSKDTIFKNGQECDILALILFTKYSQRFGRKLLWHKRNCTKRISALQPPSLRDQTIIRFEGVIGLCVGKDQEMIKRYHKKLMLLTESKRCFKGILVIRIKAKYKTCINADANVMYFLNQRIPLAETFGPAFIHLFEIVTLNGFKTDQNHFTTAFLHQSKHILVFCDIKGDLCSPYDLQLFKLHKKFFCKSLV